MCHTFWGLDLFFRSGCDIGSYWSQSRLEGMAGIDACIDLLQGPSDEKRFGN